MMCPYSREIINPHYKKLAPGHHWELYHSASDYKIIIPCGKCSVCREKRLKDWRTRLLAECHGRGSFDGIIFITLTVSDKYYDDFQQNTSLYVRKFLERYRKKYKTSVRHFMITERGTKDGRLHIHGLLFDSKAEYTEYYNLWKYGWVTIESTSSKSITYITSYITKKAKESSLQIVRDHKPLIFVSANIGKSFITNKIKHTYNNNYIP